MVVRGSPIHWINKHPKAVVESKLFGREPFPPLSQLPRLNPRVGVESLPAPKEEPVKEYTFWYPHPYDKKNLSRIPPEEKKQVVVKSRKVERLAFELENFRKALPPGADVCIRDAKGNLVDPRTMNFLYPVGGHDLKSSLPFRSRSLGPTISASNNSAYPFCSLDTWPPEAKYDPLGLLGAHYMRHPEGEFNVFKRGRSVPPVPSINCSTTEENSAPRGGGGLDSSAGKERVRGASEDPPFTLGAPAGPSYWAAGDGDFYHSRAHSVPPLQASRLRKAELNAFQSLWKGREHKVTTDFSQLRRIGARYNCYIQQTRKDQETWARRYQPDLGWAWNTRSLEGPPKATREQGELWECPWLPADR